MRRSQLFKDLAMCVPDRRNSKCKVPEVEMACGYKNRKKFCGAEEFVSARVVVQDELRKMGRAWIV